MSTWEDLKKKRGKKNSVVPQVHTTFVYDESGQNGEGLDPKYNTLNPDPTQLATDIANKEQTNLKDNGAMFTLDPNNGVHNAPYIGSSSVDNTQQTAAQDKVTPQTQTDWMRDIGIESGESEEERKAREKRERMAIGWTALAQGLSSLSNLFFTTKGAPDQQIQNVLSPTFDKITETNNYYDKQRQSARMAEHQKQQQKQQQEQQRKENLEDQIAIINARAAAEKDKQDHKAELDQFFVKLKADIAAGRLSQQQANALERIAAQGDIRAAAQQRSYNIQKNLIDYRQQHKNSEGGTAKYGDTARDEAGNWYNRAKTVSMNTMEQICGAYAEEAGMDEKDYRKLKQNTLTGRMEKTGEVDYRAMYNDLISAGYVPAEVLKKIGFVPSVSRDTPTSGGSSEKKDMRVGRGAGSSTPSAPTTDPNKSNF